MKKIIVPVIVGVLVFATAFGYNVGASENRTSGFYDQNGNSITVNGMYYNRDGQQLFNTYCYYMGEDGSPVYVGGGQVYSYDEKGDLIAGQFGYDEAGNPVVPVTCKSMRGGCSGRWQ